MNYIGLDIGKITTVAVLHQATGDLQSLAITKPEELEPIIKPGDVVAAEWTGARAKPYADLVEAHEATFYLYHPSNARGDRRHVGENQKNDYQDARTIAKLLHQYHTAPYFAPFTFTPYLTFRPILRIRELIAHARAIDRLLHKITQSLGDLAPPDVLQALKTASATAWANAEQACASHPHTATIAGAIKTLYPNADRTALVLSAYIAPLSRYPSFPHLCAYCGLSPNALKSGYRTRRQYYRAGSKEARTALFQLVNFHATTGKYRPYYDSLRAKGKDHHEALLRIMKSALRQIWRITTHHSPQPYNPPKRRTDTQQLKQAFLALIEAGYTDAQACAQLGIKQPRASHWKARSPAFLEAYIQARLRANRNVTNPEGV